MKKTTVPLIILLIVALIGGLVLVKQNQETRKGAFFATTKLFLLPSEKIIKKIGDQVPVKLWFLTEGEAKVDGVQTVVCYGDELTLDEAGIVVNTEAGFDSTPIVNFAYNVGTTGRSCATMVATSKQAADKLTTTSEVFALNFKAVKNGGGTININKSKSVVTGDNPKSTTDKEIDVTLVEGTTYWIGDDITVSPTMTPTPGACIINGECKVTGKTCCSGNTVTDNTCTGTLKRCAAKPTSTPTPIEDECGPNKPCPEGQTCITGMSQGPDPSEHSFCVPISPTCQSVWIIENNTCVQKEYCTRLPDDFVYYETKEACEDALNWCDDTHPCPAGYNCAMPEPVGASEPQGMVALRGVCIPINTPVLNYKVTFGGVIVNQDTKCAVDWPLRIMVRSAGESKVYTDIPKAITSTGKLVEYSGSLPLTGFSHLTNVTALIKGPKHLQMKYAIQNQSSRYDQYIGKLVLTTSKETSPLYNFTGYPMLAGDVVGATISDGPNGEINGVDFAYIKSLPKNVLGEASTNMNGDLDGNCMITSNDVALFRISLEAKQGELY